MLESEKAKQIAKQTVKIKSSGESNVLQSKILELRSNKGAALPDETTFKEDVQETGLKEVKVIQKSFIKHLSFLSECGACQKEVHGSSMH